MSYTELDNQLHAVVNDNISRAMFTYMILSGYKRLTAPHIIYLYGRGNNGKTTLLKKLQDYTETITISKDSIKRVNEHHKIYIIKNLQRDDIKDILDLIFINPTKSLFIIESNNIDIALYPYYSNFKTYIECPNQFTKPAPLPKKTTLIKNVPIMEESVKVVPISDFDATLSMYGIKRTGQGFYCNGQCGQDECFDQQNVFENKVLTPQSSTPNCDGNCELSWCNSFKEKQQAKNLIDF